jgi:hypothetical protein
MAASLVVQRLTERELIMHTFARVLVAAAALAALSQVSPVHVTAQEPLNSGRGPKTLVGAWFVDVTPTLVPPFVSLGIFNRDGTLTNTSSSSLGVPPESPGYGAWVKVGGQRFASTFHTVVGDGAGGLGGTQKVRALVTIGPSGDEFTGVFQVDVFFDAHGTLIVSDTGSVQGRRITVEPL